MDKYEAEKIINKYGGAIVKGTTGFIRKKSFLPCSKAKIKQAFFVYLDAIISESNNLPKEMGSNLVGTYELLNSFIDDEEADELIEIGKSIKKLNSNSLEDKEKLDRYLKYAEKSFHDGELFDEINEYIRECYNKYKIKNVQRQDDVFQKRFKAMSDEELINTFNEDVDKPGWVGIRSTFHCAIHEEFKSRGFDYSAIFSNNSFSWKNKIKLIGKKIIKQDIDDSMQIIMFRKTPVYSKKK